MNGKRTPNLAAIVLFMILLVSASMGVQGAHARIVSTVPLAAFPLSSAPPNETVKLIFIHHSCGENWLDDYNGGLGIALRDNNYFVSDTNYGWGPDGIGDNTDIGHWWSWFRGTSSVTYLTRLYTEYDKHSSYSRLSGDPGGENEIIMFKSCYPNSNFMGNPGDPPTIGNNPLRGEDCWSPLHNVGNAKGIYNDLLEYFETRQDKLFVVITAPPMQDPEYPANARAFNTWLVEEWLADYEHNNVVVFDFYNVLTSNGGNWHTNDLGSATGNHHRYVNGFIEYITDQGGNVAAYPDGGGDDHPSSAGNQKGTGEFVPMLNYFYHRWQGGEVEPTPTTTSGPAPATVTATHTDTLTPPTPATPTPTGPAQPSLTPTSADTPIVEPWLYLPIILKNYTHISTRLIQPTDLEYLGAFRLPEGPEEIGWEYSGAAMTYYPNGDPSGAMDGYPGSIFGTGHDWNQYVSEIDIPIPVIALSKDVTQLNTARTLQGFHDIRGDLFDDFEIPRVGLEYLPKQDGQATDKLYFCWGQHMQEGESGATHGWCELDLSNPQTRGTWRIGDQMNYVTNDYIFTIPQVWADTNTPGLLLATGRFRDGGQGGRGPALFAYGPWKEGNPPSPGSRLQTIPLLLYSSVSTAENLTLNNYHHSDEWSGGAWLTSHDNTAVIFVGTKGLGECWYGFADGTVWPDEPPYPPIPAPPSDDRGWWSDSFVGQMIFYDPADLAAVTRGDMQPYEPQPYATLDIDQFLFGVRSSQNKHHLGAAAFDRQRGHLYVFEPLADGDKSLVHVWRVQ